MPLGWKTNHTVFEIILFSWHLGQPNLIFAGRPTCMSTSHEFSQTLTVERISQGGVIRRGEYRIRCKYWISESCAFRLPFLFAVYSYTRFRRGITHYLSFVFILYLAKTDRVI